MRVEGGVMNVERLRMLRELPENPPSGAFNMELFNLGWVGQEFPVCGTAACLAGQMARSPEFRKIPAVAKAFPLVGPDRITTAAIPGSRDWDDEDDWGTEYSPEAVLAEVCEISFEDAAILCGVDPDVGFLAAVTPAQVVANIDRILAGGHPIPYGTERDAR